MSESAAANRKNAEYDFSDIRPYNDEEVIPVLARLVEDDEFLDAIRKLRASWVPDWLFSLLRSFLVRYLRKRIQRIRNVHDFQLIVERYLNRCVLDTTRELEVSVEQALDPKRSYLFMSNHRDIAMDPSICSLICHQTGLGTVRIAIGDNLLSKPFASDLMRLNKSFIVKRGIESRREKLNELKKLSAYMRFSVKEDAESVWIAQREGRAKDGLDKTDTALIKMLMLSKQKGQSLTDAVAELNIVPVSVSYEWDPCDVGKARELAAIARDGRYEKQEHEDISSIAAGIQGWKGRVDLHFGEEINGEFADADQVAAEVDRQVIANYRIQPSNAVAYQQLENQLPSLDEVWTDDELTAAREELATRLARLSDDKDAQLQLLQGYANPVYARLQLSPSL